MAINKVVKILMDRDGLSKKEATKLVLDTQAELIECASFDDADEIIMNNLGLEPDYLFDILSL